MKNRFSTLDLISILPEIRQKLVGMRVYQVYDVDSKTFILRFSKNAQENVEEESFKQMLILESGIRLHLTEFNWPKNANPSGLTMKLRKHIRNKRLESIKQVGVDRIVDLQFGTNEFTNHIILELFSKGNIILTDKDYNILSLVRFYKDDRTNINIAIREKYPINKQIYVAGQTTLTRQKLIEIIKSSAKDNNFKKLFNPHFLYGPSLLEHSLVQFKENTNANKFQVTEDDIDLLEKVFDFAEKQVDYFRNNCSKGYITKKSEKRQNSDELLVTYDEFHPFLFSQFQKNDINYDECESFNKAVDLFFSNMEGQRIESKMFQHEKQAFKKLDAIKKDHESRLGNLVKLQEIDNRRAQYIENNIELVDKAICVLRSAIANKYSWEIISEMVKDAQDNGDLIASKIKELKFDKNRFTMLLDDPYEDGNQSSMLIDIDIGLSAYSNARKYYDHRKDAAKKEQKTIDHSEKIFKNVERKVKQQLKETSIKTNIVLARKVLWFEKFFWFISSEGFLIIAGRDAQQNEMIVKRYLDKNDIYVHAEVHGASSLVIRNHTDNEVPPKTLNEAACMAICFSASWDAKVISNAYWVYSNQVQKTAPSGQFLSVGSFMIRGKKNFLPLQNLILGFGYLFRIDDESLEKRLQLKSKEDQLSDTGEVKAISEPNQFPDTKITFTPKLIESMDEPVEDDYTIVTTGEARKKAKVITQQTLIKKAEKLNRAEKRKNKQKKNFAKKEPDCTNTDIIVGDCGEEKNVQTEETNVDIVQPNGDQIDNIDSQFETKVKLGDNDDDDDNNDAAGDNDADEDGEENEDVIDDEDDEFKDNPNHKVLNAIRINQSLVSNPLPDDQLLYAIPVCAPYSAMHSYKYKLKIIPGTTKRGKASKTALMIFLKEKAASEREKDLLKATKDLDISKNMPGKVKIITTQQNYGK